MQQSTMLTCNASACHVSHTWMVQINNAYVLRKYFIMYLSTCTWMHPSHAHINKDSASLNFDQPGLCQMSWLCPSRLMSVSEHLFCFWPVKTCDGFAGAGRRRAARWDRMDCATWLCSTIGSFIICRLRHLLALLGIGYLRIQFRRSWRPVRSTDFCTVDVQSIDTTAV